HVAVASRMTAAWIKPQQDVEYRTVPCQSAEPLSWHCSVFNILLGLDPRRSCFSHDCDVDQAPAGC
ncbi:hypothetical protein PSZ85_24005, partial [Shigella sonnei]|nr:hypothetical protein [Shigella sonnei]